jgi:outer membrane protein assembly factor BamB
MLRRLVMLGVLGLGILGGPGTGVERAQAEEVVLEGEAFDKQSLALRTALFHEPSLQQPLDRLLEMYRTAGREEELLGLYRSHTAQYPDDAGSASVYVQLLLALKRPEAGAAVSAALEAHPENPLLLYLRHRELQQQRDPRALEALSKAVDAETDPLRKSAWTEELVAAALAEDRRDLAERQLKVLAALPDQTAAQRVALAQRLNRDGFAALALEVTAAALAASPGPEVAVELDLQAAAAESTLGQSEAAARRLDSLLSRVAPDYARRSEIVSRRVALLSSDAERAAHLQRARAAWEAAPTSESAALDLGELLVASELRREALVVLRTASERIPASSTLEKATLDLFGRLGDDRGLRDFLSERLRAQPERSDLAERLVGALYALGETQSAAAAFESLLGGMAEAEQVRRRLDLARSLRRMTLPREAADQLEKVLAADPARLDVRRELAEALMAANETERARRLLREALAPDAAIENFLDLIAFMMAPSSSATWPEARDALRDRLAREPRNFEVALRLVQVLGLLGEQAQGETVLEQARPLADTGARYAQWLEAGLALAEAADAMNAFFEAEEARLVAAAEASGGWTPERGATYMQLCEAAQRNEVSPQFIAAIKARLDDPATPASLGVPLRRLLVDALRRDPTQAVEVETHLERLAADDGERADEYRLRLARAGHEAAQRDGGRPDRVRALLQSVNVDRISDAALLRGAHTVFLEYGYIVPALKVLERLTVLEPSDAGHWEKWISALAVQGEEDRLRDALRRVLAGVTPEPLAEETLELVRGHLVDSCWRSVSRIFALGGSARLAEVLPLLEVIERTRPTGPEQLWVTWARGLALRLDGRLEAAAEAAVQLESLAGRWFAASQAAPQLVFPDGLTLSLEKAVTLLREPPASMAAPSESPAGPERSPSMRWGFATDAGAIITQVEMLGAANADGVAVLDQSGTLYHLDGETGKLHWRRGGLWSGPSSAPTPIARGRRTRAAAGFFGADGNLPVTVAPRMAVDAAGGRLLVSRDGRLRALAVDDGRVVWQADLPGVSRRMPPQPGVLPLPPLADEVFVDEAGRVLLWRAETATVAAFQPQSGKLLWLRDVGLEKPPPQLGPLNAGASCDGRRLLVYGHRPCVLDTATGTVIWGFGGETLREFPVALKSKGSGSAAGTTAGGGQTAVAMNPGGRGGFLPGGLNAPRRLAVNYLKPLVDRASVLGQWMGGSGVLVAPAVAWAEQSWQPIGGEIGRGRLLLTMPGLSLSSSLDLPLGGPRLESQAGTWLGATGGRAVFLNDHALTVFDASRGGSVTVPLGAVAVPAGEPAAGQPVGVPSALPPLFAVEGVVAGPRVFVTGPGGLLAVNPVTGRVLFSAPWPEPVRRFAGLAPDPMPGVNDPSAQALRPPGGTQFTPRYTLHSSATSNLGLRPRHAARGRWLYVVLGADRLAALAAD